MKKILLKLIILVTTFVTSLNTFAQEYGSGAQKIDGVWYSTTLYTDGSSQYAFVRDEWDWTSENKFDLNLQYPSNDVKFTLKHQTGVSYSLINWSSDKCTFTVKWDGGSYTTPQKGIKTSDSNFSTSISTNTTTLNFVRNQANLSLYMWNVYVTMAHHIKMASATTNNYGEVEIEDSKPFTVDFHSFLTKGVLIATTSNPDVFRINGTKEKTVQIAVENECEKVNQGNYNFTINFVPQAAIDYTGTVTITDGTNTVIINLSGKGTQKQPTITWVANKTIAEGDVLLNAAESNCGTKITYISADENIIKVNNGTDLEAVGVGSTEITATTAGDDKWKSETSTETFTVTTKIVQNIVWEQDFYLLKLGDEAITLNAFATDKKTGEENGNEIIYSSANEDVVKIENNILSIIGVGYATITAHQMGNDEYAPTYLTKTVIVREVADNCNGTYAFIGDNKTVTQGTVTYEFNKPGSNFTFYANITSNVRLTVTDDLGNTLHQADYNSKSAALSNISLDSKARMLMFNVYGLDTWFGAPQANTKDVTISDLIIEQAQYITPAAESVAITPTEFGKSSTTTFNVSYSAQPDVIIATLKDGKYFELENSVINSTGSCDAFGTEAFPIKFTPDSAGTFNDVLVITCKDYIKEISVTASGTGRNQLIEWNQDFGVLTLESEPIELTASSTEGLEVYYESSNTNVAIVSGDSLIIVGAGEVTITARQDGDKAHLAATPVSKTITIAKLDQTIVWNQEFDADLTIGNTIELTAEATSGLVVTYTSSNESVATIENNILTIVGAGEVIITATQKGNDIYNSVFVSKVITIAKLDQTIVWDQEFVADLTIGNIVELTATATSGETVVFTSSNESIATIVNNVLTIVGAGEVTITAFQEGNNNYNVATEVSKVITIAKLDQIIVWDQEFAADLTIGNTIELTATATSGETVVFTSSNESVATIANNVLTIVGVGEVTITASQEGNNNYNAATEVLKVITIAKLDQTIVWDQEFAADLTIGNTIELTATATSGLVVTYTSSNEEVATIANNVLTIVGVGEVTITASQEGNNNYNTATEVLKAITIAKLDQTIVWDQEFAADLIIGNTVELTAEATSGLVVTYTSSNTDVAIVENNILIIVGSGEAIITASQEGDDNYEAAQYVEKTVYISSNTELKPTNIGNNINTTLIYANNVVYFNDKHSTLRIFDMAGRQIYSADVTGKNQHNISLQRGIYIICLDNQYLKIMTK